MRKWRGYIAPFEQKEEGMVFGTDFSESMVTAIPRCNEGDAKLINYQLKRATSNGVKYTFLADAQNLEITQKFKAGLTLPSAMRLCTGVNVIH